MDVNKSIQFIDSDFRELFRIPDGGSIKITFAPDDLRDFAVRECKYVDKHHFDIIGPEKSDTHHIVIFAKLMESMGARCEPAVQLQNAEIVPFAAGDEKFYHYNREEGNVCIGHIAGDFGLHGDRFQSNWTAHNDGRNTSAFQTELHSAVYALRQSLLKDRSSMVSYCQDNPHAKLPDWYDLEHYGFKLNTDNRQYFIMCCVEPSSYDNRYIIYAYDKLAPMLETDTFMEKSFEMSLPDENEDELEP